MKTTLKIIAVYAVASWVLLKSISWLLGAV